MTTALKMLSVILGMELVGFGGVVFTNRGEARPISDDTSMMVVSGRHYIPEEDVVNEEVTDSEVISSENIDESSVEPGIHQESDEAVDDDCTSDTSFSYDDGFCDANVSGCWYSSSSFKRDGKYVDDSGFSYTWYSENVLPGGGLDIPGRHVGDEGYIYDGDGNICLASDNLPKDTVVNIPFGCGTGVVYDKGSGHNNLDIYVSW